MSLISDNIFELQKNIRAICENSGRDPNEIKLIAVSKTKPVAMIKEAIEGGVTDIGENYIQEAVEKCELLKAMNLTDRIKLHFIGRVQTNKVKYLTGFCSLLHSLDREELAEALQKRLEFEGREMDALLQINTSMETTKSGVMPSEAAKIAKVISGYDRIKIKGLMTIAENSGDENNIRKNYRELKSLSEEIKLLHLPNFEIKELSMGMSGDYKIAIEEGTTMVRIGSGIFGARG